MAVLSTTAACKVKVGFSIEAVQDIFHHHLQGQLGSRGGETLQRLKSLHTNMDSANPSMAGTGAVMLQNVLCPATHKPTARLSISDSRYLFSLAHGLLQSGANPKGDAWHRRYCRRRLW